MKKPLTILFVEDSTEDVDLLLKQLRRDGFDPQWKQVQLEEDFLAELKNAPDLILSDYSMPRFNGVRAAELLQESGLNIPFILVSGTVQEEVAVEVMKHGAADYLLKDRITRLGAAVEHALEQKRLREERRRAERELRYQKLLLEAQSEASIDGILTVDANAHILSYNRRFAEMWGVARELLAARSDGPVLQSVVDRIVDPRQFLDRVNYLYEHRDLTSQDEILLKDGSVFDRYTSPVKGTDGTYYGRIWTFRDITGRKRTEESLKLFRTLIDGSYDAVEVVDPETGRFLDFNELAHTRLGYTREEMLSMRVTDVHIAFTNDSLAEVIGDIKRDGFKIIEGIHRRKDGSLFPIEVSVRYLDLNRGYIVAVVRDITERRQTEEKITKQAALLDQAQDAITVRDLEGRIQFWNKGAEKMFGWKSGEAVGRTAFELLEENIPDIEGAVDTMLTKGEWSGELQKVARDGRKLTVEARWTLVRDSAGNPDTILAIATDVTEKKKIEAQFLRAQRMESIGTLASGIAHDLNNILAPIMMSIEVLKTTSKDPQTLGVLETLETCSQRGADIVRQVLSFGRGLEGHNIEIQPKHLLNDITRIIRDTFPKDIQLKFSTAPDAWTMRGDPTQLHQILLNLCLNARDAMPHGGKLTINIENQTLDGHDAAMNAGAKTGAYLVINVSDTGTGIPKDIIDKIFDPFFTTKEIGKGTGLGLSTVQGIVKGHGGFLNVYSEPGKGTTFRLYFPAITATDGDEKQDVQACLPRGDGETVLVIDDETSVLSLAGQTLEAFGYRALTANNGAAAVALYAQNKGKIAVVLTDMMMPIMDGRATIHALQQLNPAVKIIAASGLHTNADVARATAGGVKYFITKPYTAEALLVIIRKVLDDK